MANYSTLLMHLLTHKIYAAIAPLFYLCVSTEQPYLEPESVSWAWALARTGQPPSQPRGSLKTKIEWRGAAVPAEPKEPGICATKIFYAALLAPAVFKAAMGLPRMPASMPP